MNLLPTAAQGLGLHASSPARVRAIVVHTRGAARDRIQQRLAAHDWLECAGVAGDGTSGLRLIDAVRPELAFIGAGAPQVFGSGPTPRAHRPLLVFVGSTSEHAVVAFELGALDCLLEPVSDQRFEECLRRVRLALGLGSGRGEATPHALLFGLADRLFVRQSGRILPIPLSCVRRFEADRDYVVAHVDRGRHYLHLPLKKLEGRLDGRRFVRVHRSHIVNLEHVTGFRACHAGRLAVVLSNGDQIVASRERSRSIRRLAL